MKNTRKIFALVLVLIMALALAAPALAVQGSDGSVDIINAKKGEDYQVYRVLDLDYVAGTTAADSAYSYTVNSRFVQFFKDNLPATYTLTTAMNGEPAGTVKSSFDEDGNPLPSAVFYYIKYITEFTDVVDNSPMDMRKLENKLAKYVTDNSIVRDGFVKCENDGSAKINNLLYGYYLMVPSGEHTSAMFSLSTVTPSVTIENKSQYPTPTKTVKDADETTYKSTNTAAIGDVVNFKVTGKVPNMTAYTTYKFVISDTMQNMTYVAGSAVLKIGEETITTDSTKNTFEWDAAAKTITLTIPNLKAFDSATAGADIELTYNATIDDAASLVIGGKGNENTVKFIYSNNPNTNTTSESIPSKTTTFVLQFKIEKVNGSGQPIAGAEWKLEKRNAAGEWVELATGADKPTFTAEGGTYTYNGTAEPTTNGTGIFTWTGIDAGTYRLTETVAPAGRVRIENPIEFSITSTGTLISASSDGSTELAISLASTTGHPNVTNYSASGATGIAQMRIQNVAQSVLPSTGGAGLYVIAGIAVLSLIGFGIMAVLKKKVNGVEE